MKEWKYGSMEVKRQSLTTTLHFHSSILPFFDTGVCECCCVIDKRVRNQYKNVGEAMKGTHPWHRPSHLQMQGSK